LENDKLLDIMAFLAPEVKPDPAVVVGRMKQLDRTGKGYTLCIPFKERDRRPGFELAHSDDKTRSKEPRGG
jgi:hypothetical protein